jgi:multidrug transporter EmrE-like cation transporter
MNEFIALAYHGGFKYSLPIAYLFILGAILFETLAATLLRFSDGYKKVLPTSGVVVSYVIVFVLAAQALTALPLSIGYPVWAGGCAISTGVVGIAAFKEKKTFGKALGILLVVAGIVVLDTLTPNPIG